MMLSQADLSALPAGWLKYMIVFLVASAIATAVVVGAVVSVLQYFQSKRAASESQIREISPQPLNVEIVKAMHEQFADREEFINHITGNTKRHGELFKAIDRVEREAREEMDRRFAALAEDRKVTMEKLNTQFTYIRESLAAINTELQLNRKNK